MSKTAQISVPITNLSVGPHGPFTSGLLPSDLAGYVVDFSNDASWPVSGAVCTVTIEQSNDSGSTWNPDAAIALEGVWKDRQGNVIHTAAWNVQLDNQGSPTRKVRATVDCAQACRLGATVSSV